VTSSVLKKKIAEILPDLPDLERIVIVQRGKEMTDSGDLSYEEAMAGASDSFETVRTSKDDYAIMHYTSGTTGKPKGAVHVHNAVIGHYATAKNVLDLHDEDIYWCTADPGWVTGTSYGMFGPWSNGITQVVYEGGFSAKRWYKFIEKWKVTVWYTAPTAIRMLMKSGDELIELLMHHGVVGQLVTILVEPLFSRQFTMKQQVGNFDKSTSLCQLFNRVTPVAQNTFPAVDKCNFTGAGRRGGESGIVGEVSQF